MRFLWGKYLRLIKRIDQHMRLGSTRASEILSQDTPEEPHLPATTMGNIQALHPRFAHLHTKTQQPEVTNGQTHSSGASFYPEG